MGGNEFAWAPPEIIGLGIAALILFVLSVVQERRAAEPILPPRLFHNHTYVIVISLNLMISMVMIGGLIFMPLFLQMVYKLSSSDAGLMLIPLSCFTVAGAITAGRLVAHTGRYKIFPVIGFSIQIGRASFRERVCQYV